MAAEVEAKFLADGPGPLASLAAAPTLGDATLGPSRTVDEVDRYIDTADGRLAGAGWACRLRERAGSVRVSLKGPPDAATGGWLHRRPEIEGPAAASLDPDTWPESEARARLDRMREGRRLVERLRLVQRRTERAVTIRGKLLGTLSLDEVRAGRAGGVLTDPTLFVVELELSVAPDDDAAVALDGMAAALGRRDGLRPDPRTKLEHALDLIGSR